ncbi:MAG: FkbM family methyltransferase [Planctomycetota bacterium]
MFDNSKLYLKHRLVGTPLESVLRRLRYHQNRFSKRNHPDLLPLTEEDHLIDAIIDRTVRPNDHCWDIGAHLGSMSAMLQRRVGAEGRVHTVEPDPQKASWLKKRLRGVHACALSDSAGETTFFVNVKRRGYSGLRRHGSDNSTNGTIEQRVRLATLDELHPADDPLRLIKIDIEGAELSALRGGRETIRRCQPIILFECTQSGVDAFGYDSDAMFDFFQDELGYDIFLLDDHLMNLNAAVNGLKREPMTRAQFKQAHVYPFRAHNYAGVPKPTAKPQIQIAADAA